MSTVEEQYEAFPYPARDPADEAHRLIVGSPSHPLEIDHFLFAGCRDWSQPLRVLVAGGGTGDGLIQIAQMLRDARRPSDITYVDLSRAARRIAEARAAARGLGGIRFVTGSLLDAADLGRFDYIDCCGVLHHLPDPVAGLRALHAALAPGGGMGFMVYAPYGRSGVYPLQAAFGALFQGLSPQDRLRAARPLVAALPQGHPFRVNPNLGDHHDSDAGFYDLLLHSQDRAFTVTELLDTLASGGWTLTGFAMPGLYDLAHITDPPAHLDPAQRMAVAEQLRGTLKTHVGYAAPADEAGAGRVASPRNRALIPHVKGTDPRRLAKAVAAGQRPKLGFAGITVTPDIPRAAAPLIAAVDGRRSLAQIAAATGHDALSMGALWTRIDSELGPWGLLLYSDLLKDG